jgi:hypothetical protein
MVDLAKVKQEIQQEVARLNRILEAMDGAASGKAARKPMSEAARKRISAAQRKRWAAARAKDKKS